MNQHQLAFRTLGNPGLEGPDGDVLRGRRKELVLLAYLVRTRPRAVAREYLADLLWGSRPDANARQSLRQALLQLKRAVPDGLEADGETVALAEHAPLTIDVVDFEADLAAGRTEAAVERWAGDFLAGCEDAGGPAFRAWLETEREGLRARLRVALNALTERAERRGDLPSALRWAERLLDVFPHDEAAAGAAIRVLRRLGRTGDALARHAAFTSRHRRDLDLEPSDRFAELGTALATEAPLGQPAPPSGALFTPELVARRTALEVLDRAWTAALSGTAGLVLVEGEEGIGRTRLCEEFIRGLTPSAVVLRARGGQAERTVPHAATRELLAGLADAPGLAGARPAALAAAAHLLPALADRFPTARETTPEHGLAEAVTDLIGAVMIEAPVLLFADDFPTADRESRDVILTLVRRLRRAPLCVLLTARSGDVPADLLAELRGRTDETRVRLGGLSVEDVETLLASMLEFTPGTLAAVAHRLHAESGGNPLFLVETTALLLDEGRLIQDAQGRWRPAGLDERDLPVPPTVRDAVRRRSASLSPAGREVAAAAAVLHPHATPPCLERVTGLPADQVQVALEELQLRRVIRLPGSGGPAAFVHEQTRRTMLEDLPGSRRRRLHRLAHAALRSTDAPEGVPDAALRYHRRRARRVGLPLRWSPARAALGAAALAVVALGTLALRARQVPGSFEARDWILIADVANATGDPVFDQTLKAALYVAVSQSRHVNVLPPSRTRETLGRMHLADTTYLDERLAREVALREGGRAVVGLSIARDGEGYALTARIVDAETGDALSVLSASAPDRAQVLTALDELAAGLRRRLGERPAALRETRMPLPRATTASLDALRLYAEGMRAMDAGQTVAAVRALEGAVALDSGFASAHAALGEHLAWLNEPEAAAPHFERALALTDRLPTRERLSVQWLVARGRRDRAAAIRLAREYLQAYPDDPDAWFGLARSLQEAGDHEGALEAYRRELDIDPRAQGALVNSANLYGLLGRPADAVAMFERALALDSSELMQIAGDRNRIYGFALLSVGDTARARAAFTRLMAGRVPQQANALRSLGLLEMYLGRYRRAVDWFTQAVQLNVNDGATVSELRNRLHLAAVYRSLGEPARAREQARAALAVYRQHASMPLPWRGFLGQHLARSGLLAEAESLLAGMVAGDPPPSAVDTAAVALVRGEIALARGDAAGAVDAMTEAAAASPRNYVRQGLARALTAAGRTTEAVATYETMVADSMLGDEAQEPWLLAHLELAELYDAAGNSEAALALYRRLADAWAGGDPELPVLMRVRDRLAAEAARRR